MKKKLLGGWFLTSTVAVACLVGSVGRGQAQPAPPGSAVVLPPSIVPGTPLAEVVKLVQVGVDPSIIKAYIANSAGAFNLDADKIIALTDLGVTSDLVNLMMDHDKNLAAGITPTVVAPPPTAPPPTVVEDDSAIAAPTTEVDVNYFNTTLTPYGSWVVVEGYGRCWRPTTVIYDAGWQPYCDRGHWVYSNFGWYWDSDYSWGVTFHYGRWFHHDRFGWCWWPDTTWAPSWVTWRQSDAYCGWAPLPPFAEYRPGVGFFYRGANVAVGFDFGIDANFFTFVPAGNFCDRRLRPFRADPGHAREIFRQTAVINNFHDDHHFIINGGIPVDRINAVTHRTLRPVDVGAIHNAGREGWRGPVTAEDRAARNNYNFNQPSRQNPALRDIHNNNANVNNRENFNQRNESLNFSDRPQPAGPASDRNFNSSVPAAHSLPPTVNNRQNFNPPSQTVNRNESLNFAAHPQPGAVNDHIYNSSVPATHNPPPPINNQPVPGSPYVHNQPAVPTAPTEVPRPTRNFNDPVVTPPAARVVPPVEQRQYTAPSEPHIVTPPHAQSQAPVQTQPHNNNAGQNASGSDRNKQNQ